MDTAQWPQEIMVKPMEDHHIISNTCSSSVTAPPSNNTNNSNNNINNKAPSTSLERKIRPQKDQAVNCPRCNSTNTKFCYYNNYSLTQPRYFCKTCRRYWTEGGSLRNIPVGGGSRKNKRSSSSMSSPSSLSSPSSASKRISSHDLVAAAQSHHLNSNPNHKLLTHQGQDLNLGFPPTQHHQDFRSLSEYIQLPIMETHPNPKGQLPNSTTTTTTTDATTTNADHHHQQHQHQHHLSALELLNGLTSSRGLTSFMPMAVPDPNNGVYSSGYPSLQDFKPSLNFSLDGLGSGYGSLQGGVQVQQGDIPNNGGGGGGRLLFPFEDLKQVSNTTNNNDNGGDHNDNNNNNNNRDEQDRDDHGDSTTGYWSGMLNSGGSW